MTKKKLVPPEGGWGWAIMVAYAVYNLIFVPIMQNFGLIFKDTFAMIGLSATDGAIIITSNAACAMLMGLVNGPLLRWMSYRKASLIGALLTFIGVTATAFASKFEHFLLTYGIITSMGVGIGMSSYPLAMNSYFLKKRNKATGFAYTITGLGPILMPQLVSFLLSEYSVQGTVVIVGAISANSFVSATLLQPVKWHMKVELVEEDEENEDNRENEKKAKKEEDNALLQNGHAAEKPKLLHRATSFVDSTMSIDHDAETQSIYGIDAICSPNMPNVHTERVGRRRSASTSDNHQQSPLSKWLSAHSVDSFHCDPKSEEKAIVTISEGHEEESKDVTKNLIDSVYNPEMSVKVKEKKCCNGFLQGVVNFFDLSLLEDPKYVNIMIGMSLAIFAELNFSLLTPFILADIGLNTQRIAAFISVLSGADLVFRFVSPFIGDYFEASARMMYMISLSMLIVTRYSLLFFSEFAPLMGVAVGLGVAKGVRTVYMNLVIPNYVPLERLASASGLQMVVNGCLILAGGPLLGVIRDVTGSYTKCIYIMNLMSLSTIVMWTTEMIYERIRRKKQLTNENG